MQTQGLVDYAIKRPLPFLPLCATILCLLACGAAAAQAYPTKPIRFIVPFPPGGGTDILGRIVGQKLGDNIGQTVLIDNRPGAGANIGAEIAAHSAPDGYTIVMANIAHAVNMTLYKNRGYDLVHDFAPVTLLAATPNILVVHPSVAAKSVPELIALAKAKPGTLNYASSGSGSSSHLAGELFKNMTTVNLVHIPYKGGGPAVTSLLAGETVVGFATAPSVLQYVKAGKLRALAVSTAKRSDAAPDLPTIAETGLPGYDANTWYGVMFPAKTSPAIVNRLHDELVRIMKTADMRERVAVHGYEPATNTPQEFSAYIKAEVLKWGKVVKAAGIHAD
jgi:tripartite-type tricarboxylate transporter receptor subunit TctC